MFEFKKEGWKSNRGTGGTIILYPKKEQILKEEDVIKLNVYNKFKLEEEPLLTKIAEIDTNKNTATIIITNSEMEFAPISNKKEIYWYEVKFNGGTIIGHDKRGPKELELYPEGSED